MNKVQALNSFWNSFGIPAYDENTVPDDVEMPYITFEVSTGRIEDAISLSASLWYRSQSWSEITEKADEIGQALNEMPSAIKLDNGRLYLYQGSPFQMRMAEPDDAGVRRILLNVQTEFLTAY